MNSIVRYTLITALRDWLFLGILGLLFLHRALSMILGGTALVEQHFSTIAIRCGYISDNYRGGDGAIHMFPRTQKL